MTLHERPGWALVQAAEQHLLEPLVFAHVQAALSACTARFMASIVTGDAGHAQRAQLLRMLQFERGYYGDGAPPWEQPDPYRINSPLWSAASVKTPLLLVHGDQDYIPVQQAEEFFTALCTEPRRIPATILLLPPPPRSPANLSKRAADWS